MKLSLVIPCYNEAANLPLLLPKCAQVVRAGEIEVILVDNGSTDNTACLLTEFLPRFPGCRSVRVEKNQGYGFGILAGLEASQGSILGWTHADLQTDPTDACRALALFDRYGNDIFVKGRRYGRPSSDVLFTMGMSVFETVLLATPLWDINAQPTLFNRELFQTWRDAPHDFALDLYAYFQAKRVGVPVHRLPVDFGQRASGVSHWNTGWSAKRRFIGRTVDFSLDLRRRIRARQ